MNIAAVLEFGHVPDPAGVVDVVVRRLGSIPRMRQRLHRPGLGRGRPLWVDDDCFDHRRHVRQADLPPGVLVCRRMDPAHPLWRLYWSITADGLRVVIVIHHVLADGLGGLAALAALVDGLPAPAPQPAPLPSSRELAHDAQASRSRAVRELPRSVREFGAGLREMGLTGGRPAMVPPSSILRPTSSTREVRAIRVPLETVVTAAHANGVTVNDVVLAAVVGVLRELLGRRGERPPQIVVSVPVSGRTAAAELGNQVGAIPVAVPNAMQAAEALAHIHTSTTRAKAQQRGSSAHVLSVVFRGLASLGLGQFFVDHQRLIHSFETNMRGPSDPIVIAGHPVRSITPIAVNPGNVGVSFDVLSYAGVLTIAVVTCPRVVPEGDWLAAQLSAHEW